MAVDIPATSDAIPGTLVLRDSSSSIAINNLSLLNGSRITGDFSSNTLSERVFFQTNEVNAPGSVGIIPNGSSQYTNFAVYGNSDIDNSPVAVFEISSGVVGVNCTKYGTASNPPFRVTSGGSERIRVKTTGQVRFIPLAADPAGAEAGDVYYNSGSNKLKVYNGTSWVDLH